MLEKFSLRITYYAFLISCVSCWQIFLPFPEEADTYFVMNIGRYVFEHGIPYVDPFTIHENLKLVAQQWLSGVIFWEVFKNFGVDGLRATDAIFGAATILIYWRLCLFVSGGNKTLSFVLSFVVGLLIMPATVPRPQLFSTLLLLIEVFALEKFTRTGDAKFLLPLPIISIALINLHAAIWIMSLVVCLPFLFVRDIRHGKFLLVAMVGIFICGLINPYGLDAMTYVFRSYGVGMMSENIPEMMSPTAHDTSGKIFYLVEAFIIFSLAKFKVPWRYIFLSGGIIFMALMHERSLVLFYMLATFPIAFAWKNFTVKKFGGAGLPKILFALLIFVNVALLTTILDEKLPKISVPLEILLFAATICLLYNLLVVKLEGRILHPQIIPKKIFPLFVTAMIFVGIFLTTFDDRNNFDKTFTSAIEFILRTESPENVALYVNQGVGGLAGNFGMKYYIDSRSEVFLRANNGQKNILAEYVDFTSGRNYYADFFSRYKFTHIILTSNEPFIFDQMSRDKNFRVIYESERVDRYNVVRCKIFVPR